MTTATRTDIQQAVTDSIIARIEEGGLLPWQCPWTMTGEQPIPYNWLTKQSYNGINILILWMRAMMCGYSTNAWLTFKQARQLKGHVRKGEKAVQCIFVKRIEVDDESTEGEVDENGKRIYGPNPFCKDQYTFWRRVRLLAYIRPLSGRLLPTASMVDLRTLSSSLLRPRRPVR